MTKVISISDEAYGRLAMLKKEKDSFSKVIIKLTAPKKSLMSFAGVWEDQPELDGIYKKILEDRHKRLDRGLLKW